MRQKPYIKVRSRTPLWVERANTSRMTTMATSPFFENVKQKKTLTSHQSLLICLQVKADAKEALHTNAFANVIVSRARDHIKDDHDGNMKTCSKCQTTKPANQPSIMASLFAGDSWCDRNSTYHCVRELYRKQSARTHQGWPRWQHSHLLKMSNNKTRQLAINHCLCVRRLKLMRQKLYITLRSRTSVWAERANTSHFWKCQKPNKTLTSHQSLLICSQVEADATDTLYTNALANVSVSRARDTTRMIHTMMQHRTTNEGVHEFVNSDKVYFMITCLMLFVERRVFPTEFQSHSRIMQERTTHRGSSRFRKFGQIMFQNHLLDVILWETFILYIVLRVFQNHATPKNWTRQFTNS